MTRIPLTIPQYKDLLTRIVATCDNLAAAEAAGDAAAVEKLRAGKIYGEEKIPWALEHFFKPDCNSFHTAP